MKRICIGLAMALVFAVFGTATALAQPAKGEAFVDFDSSGKIDVSVVLPGDVQEEVEILRRLLDKSLSVYHSVSGPSQAIADFGAPSGGMGIAMAGMSSSPFTVWSITSQLTTPHMEGVYLKGYGVVYTGTLPLPSGNVLTVLPGPNAEVVNRTPLTPWERTRKELRGEKIEVEGNAVVASPSLSEFILKDLADNGKHFTLLGEGERITVAVTFRDDAANGIDHPQPAGASGGYSMSGMMPGGGSPNGSSKPRMASPGGLTPSSSPMALPGWSTPSSPRPASEDDAAWLAEVRNGLRLGDFHVKHQNYPAALVAYKNAQEILQKAFDGNKTLSPEDAANVLTTAYLYLQLAKGYESADDNAAARKAMEKVGSLSKMAATLAGTESTVRAPRSTPAQLPSKLVVSASKKLLDEVGSGKMTFDAFRKAATVEYVKPPAAEKK